MESEPKYFRLKVVLAVVVSMALVVYLDYITGYNLHFYAFYFIPVSICAWYLGRVSVVVTAAVGTVAWGTVDHLVGDPYPSEWYLVWNCCIHLAGVGTLGLVVQRLRTSLKDVKREREELAEALGELHRSTEKIQKMQSQLQVVCAWSNRVKVEGRWISMEQFLKTQLGMTLSHGMSPEAVEEFKREIEKINKPPESPAGEGH
jgi:hypothetical protein